MNTLNTSYTHWYEDQIEKHHFQVAQHMHRCIHAYCLKIIYLVWLAWLSGLSADLRNKGPPVRFPVRAHAWVVGQVPSRG